MRLERFDEQAQEAFQTAQEIMQEQRHTQLDVEHIFVALLRQPDSAVGHMLAQLGADPATVARQVEQALDQAPKVYGQYGYVDQVYIMPRTQRLVTRADAEAQRLGAKFIEPQHLFMALAGERDGASARILQSFGIDQERVYQAIDETYSASAASPQQERSTPMEIDARIAALELEKQHLQESLTRAEAELAYTRKLLEQEIAQRHWAERQRVEREKGGTEPHDSTDKPA